MEKKDFFFSMENTVTYLPSVDREAAAYLPRTLSYKNFPLNLLILSSKMVASLPFYLNSRHWTSVRN